VKVLPFLADKQIT